MEKESTSFLKQKYELHNAPEVEQAVERTEKRTGEKVPQKPAERIQNYLNRFKEIIERPDLEKRERGIRALKEVLYDKFVIKPENISEAYWDNLKRIARERGQGADLEQVDWQTLQNQNTEAILIDQKASLDNWLDYLTSKDATYPDWLKYYAFRSILGMAEYDKEKKQFTKRSKGTVKPFPDLNREALAYVLDAVEKKYQPQTAEQKRLEQENEAQLTDEQKTEQKEFVKLLQGENFGKLYAWAIEKVTPESQDALANTKGQWVKYEQGSDHMPLVDSLQGHGTGWCTAGESTAKTQLENGDFYVYYSLDQQGKPTIPRVAIRMDGQNTIGEIRGIAHEQNLDPYIGDVVKEKLKEFPDSNQYEKKSADMKQLTEIEKKIKQGILLNKDELVFLYEINSSIEGFGYQKDPRIAELRTGRNSEIDMPIVFECQPEQITRTSDDINENTKAYVGKLEPGIFQKLPENLEHIYTEFPEKKIRREDIEIGGKSSEQLLSEMGQAGINISSYAKDMLKSRDFIVGKNVESLTLVRLTVSDLGFTKNATIDQIYQRAQAIGLDLCPAEVGPHYRLKYQDQHMNEWIYIGVRPIIGSNGDPCVFHLNRNDDGLWLDDDWAPPYSEWDLGNEFVFCVRK